MDDRGCLAQPLNGTTRRRSGLVAHGAARRGGQG
jgi:hypothetical protein